MKNSKLLLPALVFGLGPLLSYVALPFITSTIAATEFGNYTYFLSVLNIIAFFSLFPALNATVNRYANTDNSSYNNDIFILRRFYLLSFILYMTFTFFFIFYSEIKMYREFLIIALSFICVNLFNAIKSYLLINNNKMSYSFFMVCICIFQYSYIFISLFFDKLRIEDLLFGNVILMLLFFVFKRQYLRSFFSIRGDDNREYRKVVNFILVSFLVSFSTVLYNNTDKLMMDAFLPDASHIALYQVSFQIFAFPIESLYALFSIFMPAFLYRAFDKNRLQYIKNLKITFKLVLFVIYCITQFLLIFKNEIKSLLLDSDYIVNDSLPLIFVISQSTFLLYLIATNIFIVNNKRKYVIFSLLSSSLLNVLLNFYLIPKFGYIGAAFSTMISYFVLLLLILYFSMLVFRINYFDFSDFLLLSSAILISYSFYDQEVLWLFSMAIGSSLYFRKEVKSSFISFLKGV